MSTIISSLFKINGVIDTDKPVLENLQTIASAAGSWLSYDSQNGKWAVVINQAGSSVASFGDSNIIGSINVSGSGLEEFYNSVEIEFPHKDIKDRKDFIAFNIDAGDRYPNEVDNKLKIALDCVNDPIQAALLASRELKQSRVDKIVEFRTDYSYMSLTAGDLIDITSTQYGFTNKVFRIISIEEVDDEDGALSYSITALEYDANVYSTAGLTRKDRFIDNSIVSKRNNEAVKASDDADVSASLGRLLIANALASLLSPNKSLLSKLFDFVFDRDPETGEITQTIRSKIPDEFLLPQVTITGPSSACEGETITLTITTDACIPDGTELPYEITGVTSDDIDLPLEGTVEFTNKTATIDIPILEDADSSTESLTFSIYCINKVVTINNKLSFTYLTEASPTSITEGQSSTVLLTTTGVADGTSVPYTISGDANGRITTALSGNVTVNGNQASLVVNTTDDAVYTGDPVNVTVTFNSAQADPCGQLDKTAVITILDNDPAPPTPTPDVPCQTVQIPVVWCPSYDGDDGEVKSLSVVRYATVQAPVSGGPTINVPTAVSITKGNPSTVTVTATAAIDVSSNKPGIEFTVITAFNTIPPNGIVTGTTTTIIGY